MKKSILIALAAIILSVIGCTKPEEGGNDNPPTPPQEQIIISQDQYNLKAEGGSITVEVSSNVAVTMTIPEDIDWITENKTKSVSTSTFYLDVAANETKEARSAEITFSNEESGLSEKITVNQEGKIYVPVTDMVDLGLSVKWATCNIGATKPEEYGGYYQWAGTQDVTSTNIYLYWNNFPYHDPDSEPQRGYTKYIPSDIYWYWSGIGSPDDKTILDLNDDVAHVTLGGSWRMPTKDEFEELKNNCTSTWTKDYNGTGVAGLIVTSNVSGYTDKYIFLPAAGWRTDDYLTATDFGYYWTSSLDIDGPQSAFGAVFNIAGWNKDKNWNVSNRYKGHSVRPVYADGGKIRVSGVSLDPTNLELNIGETSTLSATVTPSYAADKGISWTSSDTDVATVDQDGKVTAVKAGSATITATTTDGGYTATCNITVTIMSNIEDPEEGDDWEWDNSEKTTAK